MYENLLSMCQHIIVEDQVYHDVMNMAKDVNETDNH